MADEEAESLQKVLKGEYMGIDAYQTYLNKLHNDFIRHDLERHEMDLRRMATELESFIRDRYNGAPGGSGLAGEMAGIQASFHLRGDPSDPKVLDAMYEGVKMGVDQTEKVLAHLDDESRELVEKHLEKNKRMLKEIDHFRMELH